MNEKQILNRCQKQVAKFNEDYQALCREFGDTEILVDEDRDFYGLSEPLSLVQDPDDHLWRLECDGFLSDPIYDYYEDTGELFDNTGDGEWGDGFKACLNQYKKDLRRGKRFLAMPAEKIDAVQNGDEEDIED